MLIDSKLSFVPLGSPLSLVAAAGVDVLAPGIIDLLGDGPGTPIRSHLGNAALPGQADAMGVGSVRPELVVAIGTALVADTGVPLLTAQLQAAPDDGSNNPGTYQILVQGHPVTAAQGTAGRQIFRVPWVPPFPENLRPRFLRMNFEIPAGTNYSAGTIAYALVTQARDDWFVGQAAKNYGLGPLS